MNQIGVTDYDNEVNGPHCRPYIRLLSYRHTSEAQLDFTVYSLYSCPMGSHKAVIYCTNKVGFNLLVVKLFIGFWSSGPKVCPFILGHWEY